MSEEQKIPNSIYWTLSPREKQKVQFLFESLGIDQGTQLVKTAVSQLYNKESKARGKYISADQLEDCPQ